MGPGMLDGVFEGIIGVFVTMLILIVVLTLQLIFDFPWETWKPVVQGSLVFAILCFIKSKF